MRRFAWLAFGAMAMAAGLLRAEVADSGPGGFTVKLALDIQAPPADVYRKFVQNVGDWWNSQHTFSGSAHNLSIDDKATGCFCEKLPKGGGVRHMEVVFVDPGKTMVLTGGLGPFQAMAATGTLRIVLTPASGGTKLELTYAVAGYLPAGMGTYAGAADGMLTDQFTRLKSYIERGSPTAR